MKLIVLKTVFAEDFEDRREQWREAHFAYLRQAIDRGELMLAGHMPKADGRPFGDGLLIFQTGDTATVEAFAQNDPYARNGLVASWSVSPWNAVVRPKSWTVSAIDV